MAPGGAGRDDEFLRRESGARSLRGVPRLVEIGAARRRTTGEGSTQRATRCLAASPGAVTPERFGQGASAWRSTQRVPRDRYRPAQDGPARAIPGTTNAMADPQHNALLSSVGASNAQVQLQLSQ